MTSLGKKIILKAQNNDTQCNNKDIFDLNGTPRVIRGDTLGVRKNISVSTQEIDSPSKLRFSPDK